MMVFWKWIKDALDETPPGHESKVDFEARLVRCAKTLPKGVVKTTIAKMSTKIKATFKSKGHHDKAG